MKTDVSGADVLTKRRNREAARAWLCLLSGLIFVSYMPLSLASNVDMVCSPNIPGYTPPMGWRCSFAWVAKPIGFGVLALSAWPLFRLLSRDGLASSRALLKRDLEGFGALIAVVALTVFVAGLASLFVWLKVNINLSPGGSNTLIFNPYERWSVWHFWWPTALVLGFAAIGAVAFSVRFSASIRRDRMRGADIIDPKEYLRRYGERFPNPPPPVELAGIPFPPNNERLHFAISASTGAGKTVSLRSLLSSIQKRGDRAVILDNNSEFLRSFKRPTDLVLSPFDPDFPGWRLANEAVRTYDWERLSESFVPQGGESAAEWHGMAKALFGAIGQGLSKKHPEGFTNDEFQWLLTEAEPAVFADLVRGTTAAVLASTDEHNARRLQSVRMSFIQHLKAWRYVKDGDFSFRKWIAEDSDQWLFLPYSDYEMTIARDLLGAWVDTMVMAALERPANVPPPRTTWIIIDELNSLGEISALIMGATRLRKAGVAIVVAVQDFPQLRETYGPNRAETLMNNFSNKLVMRTTEGTAAEHLSKQLGEREMLETSEGVSKTSGQSGSLSRSQSQSIVTERLVLPSEIQKLPDLEGYLDFAGDWPVIKIKVPLPEAPPAS